MSLCSASGLTPCAARKASIPETISSFTPSRLRKLSNSDYPFQYPCYKDSTTFFPLVKEVFPC